jgi:hypothetical protein
MEHFGSEGSKNIDPVEIPLPPIPENFVRLTHFTTEEVAKKIVDNGESFNYGKNLTINLTTDAFSSNDQVKDIIETRKNGAFSRASFGNSVMIIDLNIEEHKKRCRLGAYEDKEIPNHNILGYLSLKNSSNLHENSRYSPIENQLTPNLTKGEIHIESMETDGQQVQGSEDNDVW